MHRRIALITTLLVLAIAAPALAQGGSDVGPLNLPPVDTPAPTNVATATPTPSDSGTTGRDTLFIIGGALLIGFAVMGWFILKDARRVVPEVALHEGQLRDQGPHKHQKQAKAKARARTRAQKQARKANRPRA
jgi:predicted small lipoprotein YifL